MRKVKEGKYAIVKDIPLGGNDKIKAGLSLYVTHGCVYMDGGLLSDDFQEDFRNLLINETNNGWNYLRPDAF